MVNPDWLRYFIVLTEAKNFGAAAERLHLSPQALSHAVAGLEAHYGQKLVLRDRKYHGLTAAGEALLAEAPGVLAGLERMDLALRQATATGPQGPLRVGGPGYVVTHLLPSALAALVQEHPALRPSAFAVSGDEAERELLEGGLDLAILTAPPGRPGLASKQGPAFPYLIVGPPGPVQPWHELGWVVPRRLGATPGGTGCASERALEGPWPETAHPRRVVAEAEALEVALAMAAAGLGAVYTPEAAVRARLKRGELAVRGEAPEPFTEQLHLAWRRGQKPEAAVLEAIAALA